MKQIHTLAMIAFLALTGCDFEAMHASNCEHGKKLQRQIESCDESPSCRTTVDDIRNRDYYLESCRE